MGSLSKDSVGKARAALVEAAEAAAQMAVERLKESKLPNVAELTALVNASANALDVACRIKLEPE